MNHQPDTADEPASEILASQALAIANYIARGINHGCGDCVGLELEHFVVRRDNLAHVPYLDDPTSGATGVESILERLAPLYDERVYETRSDGKRHLIGLSRPYANVTLEPGAQLEISIGPVFDIREIDVIYRDFRSELDPVLDDCGYRLLELGYHPTASAHEIPLIPKNRYRLMDEHFKTTGRHGICMMRATASTQVSIDYASEADAVRKFRIANALGPLLAFITDNTPLFEGRPIGSGGTGPTGLAIPARMARTAIWDDVDAARSMLAPHTFDEDFGFYSYASSVLQAPAIFTLEDDEDAQRPADKGDGVDSGENDGASVIGGSGVSSGVSSASDGDGVDNASDASGGSSASDARANGKHNAWQGMRTFTDALAGHPLDRATIEHVLSLFFFDVRFKTYIEIRMADSLPIDYALAFATLIKGLFYHEENLRQAEELLAHPEHPEPLNAAAIARAKAALQDAGYDAVVYGRPATEWLDTLIEMAQRALDAEERSYLEPLAKLVAARATLADEAQAR
ncbi:MAG: hypothetical protein LBP24_05500 [Coriobacteriales bacterium]|jgi:glutamate--cysteine ligase|nr:hypothetical protein [Coriobacteriales bacterium]